MEKQEIILSYYKDIIDEKDLNEFENELMEYNISLIKFDKSGEPMNADPSLLADIAIERGKYAVGSYIWDKLKLTQKIDDTLSNIRTLLINLWSKCDNKFISVLQNRKISKKELTFGLLIRTYDNEFVQAMFPKEVPDDEKEECFKKFQQFYKDLKNKTGFNSYLEYDINKKCWTTFDFSKLTKKTKSSIASCGLKKEEKLS